MEEEIEKGRVDSEAKEPGPPPYDRICSFWALSDHWPLWDAIDLLLEIPPAFYGPPKLEAKIEQKRRLVHEIALNCVGESLEVLDKAAPVEQLRVYPQQFLEWARKRDIPVPSELAAAVEEKALKLGKRVAPSGLAPKQRHRERCKGIAALLWSSEPELTKGEMAARTEILEFGCEGKAYTPKTIQDWIKTENPNRQPGRRPSKKSE